MENDSLASDTTQILEGIDVINMELSVRDACHIMANSTHDHFPVVDANKHVFGMLSPVDILRFLDTDGNPNSTKAWEICSHSLVTANTNLSPKQIAKIMLDSGVHHVLLKKENRIVGIRSLWDIVKQLTDVGEIMEKQ
jgi:CBS domain-containing protein